MSLKFGDLQAKADAIELRKNSRRFERRVFIATESLRVLRKLPEPNAQIWDYPSAIQRLGLAVCQEANRRLRKAETQTAKNVPT